MGDDDAQNGPDVQNEPDTPVQAKPKGHGAKFDRKMEEAIMALLTHQSVDAAARAVGVSPATVVRWMKDPEFDGAYRAARRAAVGQSGARIQQGTGLAVSVLLKVMVDSSTPASVRVRAADSVLNHAAKTIELEDIEARVAKLEQATNDANEGRRN